MKVRGLFIASLVLALVMTGVAFHASSLLPPGTQLPTHWNAAGEPDRFADAFKALFMPAAFVLIFAAAFGVIPWIEPLQEKLAGSGPLLRTVWIGLLVMMVLTQMVIAAPAYGLEAPHDLILIALGGLLIAIGNMLPKSRPGFFVGIRTPWTLIDTDIWVATHRLGGKVMMLAGGFVILAALAPVSGAFRSAVVLVAILAAGFIPFGYSFWLWRQRGQ